jgi:outer membrane protein assembly factor BamB
VTRATAILLAGALAAALTAVPTLAATREGVRILGDLRVSDLSGDGIPDWLAGRAECFSKVAGQPEVTTPCLALIDGRRWVPLWRKNVPRFGRFPAVLAGRFVVLDVGEPLFAAFDGTRPEVFWEFRMEDVHREPMVPVGARVLVTIGPDHLLLVDPEARRPIWDRRLFSPLTRPPVVAGRRVIAATEKQVTGLRVSDGSVAWSLRGRLAALAANDGDSVYLATEAGREVRVIAVATATGASRWRRAWPSPGAPSLLIGQDHLFAFGSAEVVALDRRLGSVAWRADVPVRPSPIAADERVVVALLDPPAAPQRLVAYDRETGKALWSRSIAGWRYEPTGWLRGGVAVLWARESAAAGARQGRVDGIDAATGAPRWKYESPEKILAIVSVDAGVLWLQRERGLSALDLRTGAEVGQHPLTALARAERTLAERLRYLVYIVPPLVILAGIGAWLRYRLRRR